MHARKAIDIAKHACARAQDMLGLKKHGEFRSEKENVDEDILTMGYEYASGLALLT